jgi:ABC-type transporter Mla subunit MlaD
MKNDKSALKAGLFIVTCIVLAVGILVAIKGTGSLFDPMRTVSVAFDLTENVGGLKVGDTVRVGGHDQGRVTAIRYMADGNNKGSRLEADFTLPTRYDIREDAIVQIEQGLTGTANLNISAFGTGKPFVPGQLLDGQASSLAQLYEVAGEAKALLAQVRTKIDPAYARFEGTMTRVDTAVDTGRDALANVRDLFGETKLDFRGTVANLNVATGTLKDRLPESLTKIDKLLETTTSTIEGAKGTLEDVKAAAGNAKDATAEARSLLVRNRSRIDAMIAGLRGTSSNLELASAEIRRNPWRLLYQPKPEEVSNLNVYDTARQFAEAATNLNDAAGAVRDALKDPAIRGEQLNPLLQKLDTSFSNYAEVEKKLWDAVR